MNKYNIAVPIVGYTYCEVEADNKEEAKEKALDICCNFEDKNVDIVELYGVEHVCQGNCVDHPLWNIEIEESEE